MFFFHSQMQDRNPLAHVYFNTERNNLDGTIPDELSNLEDLEFLGMENGNLVGRIPTSIESLTKLYFIDLDFNNLTGEIAEQVLFLYLSL